MTICTELRGKVDSWTQEEWAGILKTNRIIVGLPEVLKRALVQRAYIHPTQFSLIVFDECDSVTGNSPSAAIMRDSVLQCSESSRPRILGLTASFVCGSTSCEEDIVKKRADLEMLLQSTIFSPVISTEHKKAKKFYHVLYPDDGIKKFKHTVKDFMREILNSIPETLLDDMGREKSVNKGWNLFSSVGSEGLRYVRISYLLCVHICYVAAYYLAM